MKLSRLLENVRTTSEYTDVEVLDVTDKSGEISPGCVFVCIKGARFDGHSVAEEALSKGAAAVVTERRLGLPNEIVTENTRDAYSRICAAFYGNPAEKLKLIGITGTNGKTTTTFLIKNIFDRLSVKSGLIGTVKNITGDREYTSSLTTPDSKELQSLFREMVDSGCEYCIMEVSSQALAQGRVDGCRFSIAMFTNLTQDHLDYHETFENYKNAKKKLFEICDTAIVNADDPYAEYMTQGLDCRVVRFGVNSTECDYFAKNIRCTRDSVRYEFLHGDRIGRAFVKIPGHFTVYNSLGAAACAVETGADFDSVLTALSDSKGIPGRVEVVPTDTDYTVIIDYAHSPDGLENVISSLRENAEGRIITVFGCGGDRDKTKRPKMGKVVGDLSDIAVVTSDNPRTENPSLIIKDILEGMKNCSAQMHVVEDRTQAIKLAMSIAEAGDIVLLAGKGHETYQILGTGKIHYDEREKVRDILEGKI
ncbi:MAG: UDP-N-acetylmuramoyl-L-alanyl-D-glutamate--2,6-diaminopimelate ligase [Ruminococcaceae bacterium]|nr:UDP-N-acetylmuramoyl-L-alanyl-D-glutamate--2,6-diaminopimelate ligase [Oscillospiraceae bacterium]